MFLSLFWYLMSFSQRYGIRFTCYQTGKHGLQIKVYHCLNKPCTPTCSFVQFSHVWSARYFQNNIKLVLSNLPVQEHKSKLLVFHYTASLEYSELNLTRKKCNACKINLLVILILIMLQTS